MPSRVHFGVMVEVPALLFQLEEALPLVDFVSIGSNDLMQYFYAADRGNARVSGRFDPLSPAFLRALGTMVERLGATKSRPRCAARSAVARSRRWR